MWKRSIKDFIIQNGEVDDDMLHRKLFNVNMRLFSINKEYRKLVLGTVSYMKKVAKKGFKDYTKAKGISGANVGIPFNIIGVKNNGRWDFFLNPRYLKKSWKKETAKSNCGSLQLKEPIEIERYKWIKVEYYNLKGKKEIDYFDGRYGYTVQHEMEHNQGVLIVDERV